MEFLKSLFYENLKYLGWILLFVVLWIRGCSDDEKSTVTAKVLVPEVKGKFEPKKPVNTAIGQKVSKGKTVYIDNPIDPLLLAENENLKQDFAKASDSIKKLQFAKAIQLNRFSDLLHLVLRLVNRGDEEFDGNNGDCS